MRTEVVTRRNEKRKQKTSMRIGGKKKKKAGAGFFVSSERKSLKGGGAVDIYLYLQSCGSSMPILFWCCRSSGCFLQWWCQEKHSITRLADFCDTDLLGRLVMRRLMIAPDS